MLFCNICNITVGPVSIGTFIAVSIPNQLKHLGRQNVNGITLQPPESRNRYIYSRAQELVEEEDGHKNYIKIAPGMKLKDGSLTPVEGSYVFNSSSSLWQVSTTDILYFCNKLCLVE
jgi:hypothetical protein